MYHFEFSKNDKRPSRRECEGVPTPSALNTKKEKSLWHTRRDHAKGSTRKEFFT